MPQWNDKFAFLFVFDLEEHLNSIWPRKKRSWKSRAYLLFFDILLFWSHKRTSSICCGQFSQTSNKEHENVLLYLSQHLCPQTLYTWQCVEAVTLTQVAEKLAWSMTLAHHNCVHRQEMCLSLERAANGSARSKVCLRQLQRAPAAKKPCPLLETELTSYDQGRRAQLRCRAWQMQLRKPFCSESIYVFH